MTEDEKFFAWLDGELSASEAAEVEARVAADPDLARRADRHRAFGARLHRAFDPIAAAPLPQRFAARPQPHDNVADFNAAKRRRALPARPAWTAVAAILAVGILLGTFVPRSGSDPVRIQDGALYAAASLDKALDTELASAPSGDVRIGLTYRAQSGEICRTFTSSAASGLACRKGDRWRLRGLFAAPEGQATDYRMAAGMDPNLASLVDSTMAGEPFDPAHEAMEQRRRWH